MNSRRAWPGSFYHRKSNTLKLIPLNSSALWTFGFAWVRFWRKFLLFKKNEWNLFLIWFLISHSSQFTSDNGKVRVCVTRNGAYKYPINTNKEENDRRKIECKETSGTYVDPETMRKDIEFTYTKPCPDRKRENCDPIYVSITPTDVPVASGAVGFDCSRKFRLKKGLTIKKATFQFWIWMNSFAEFGCETPDQVKITWTHYDMRCNSASQLFSSSILASSILLSLVYIWKSL